jgi:hypothetical protein
MESLIKLRHTSTIPEYTSQFESLSNRLWGLSDKYKLSCFLSGLKEEIHLPLRMLAPQDLVSGFGLAKLQVGNSYCWSQSWGHSTSSSSPSDSVTPTP